MIFKKLFITLIVLASTQLISANDNKYLEAQNGPGITPNWSSAKKNLVGTSYHDYKFDPKSLVWFTSSDGILTETYYPTIDQAQIKDAQILVSDGKSFFVEEKKQMRHQVNFHSYDTYKLENTDFANRFKITHHYFTLHDSSTLVDEITIQSNQDDLDFYLLVNPAIGNTGFHDNAKVENESIVFTDNQQTQINLRVSTSIDIEKLNVGFSGVNDGYRDIQENFKMDNHYQIAKDGNVVGLMKLKLPKKVFKKTFYIFYDFSDRKDLKSINLQQKKYEYTKKWTDYLKSLKAPQELSSKLRKLYYRSMFILKVHEDKLNPGAMIASLSKPWGEQSFETPGKFNGGYHLVWPRDLYHVTQALTEAGDIQTSLRALRFLKSIQYQRGVWNYDGRTILKKGAFPQNTWTNKSEYWSGYQLDQVAYPIHVFYKLYKNASHPLKKIYLLEFEDMLKNALNFILTYGPWTAQERWEENFGISPSSFAAATSALMMGARIFSNLDYFKTADSWLNKDGDNIHTWTFTKNGYYSYGEYYVRIAGCSHHTDNWNPNQMKYCIIANSGQTFEQTQILDQGFLKLSLLGLVDPTDNKIKKSLNLVNTFLKVKTPSGFGWYRYSFDAYGENKKGRLWPILSSEHARYALDRFNSDDLSWNDAKREIKATLRSYTRFTNDGDLLPEQVFEKTGKGTGAATPLAWSHAEFVKLLYSFEKKRNIENLLSF